MQATIIDAGFYLGKEVKRPRKQVYARFKFLAKDGTYHEQLYRVGNALIQQLNEGTVTISKDRRYLLTRYKEFVIPPRCPFGELLTSFAEAGVFKFALYSGNLGMFIGLNAEWFTRGYYYNSGIGTCDFVYSFHMRQKTLDEANALRKTLAILKIQYRDEKAEHEQLRVQILRWFGKEIQLP